MHLIRKQEESGQQEMVDRSKTPASVGSERSKTPHFLIPVPPCPSEASMDRSLFPFYVDDGRGSLTEPLFTKPGFWNGCDPESAMSVFDRGSPPLPEPRKSAALLFAPVNKHEPEPQKGWRRYLCCFQG